MKTQRHPKLFHICLYFFIIDSTVINQIQDIPDINEPVLDENPADNNTFMPIDYDIDIDYTQSWNISDPPAWPDRDDPDYPHYPSGPVNPVDSSTTTASTSVAKPNETPVTPENKNDNLITEDPISNNMTFVDGDVPIDTDDRPKNTDEKEYEPMWPIVLIAITFICILALGIYWSIIKYRAIKTEEMEFEERYKQRAVRPTTAAGPGGPSKTASGKEEAVPRTPTTESVRSNDDYPTSASTNEQTDNPQNNSLPKGSVSTVHTISSDSDPVVEEDAESKSSTASNRSDISNEN